MTHVQWASKFSVRSTTIKVQRTMFLLIIFSVVTVTSSNQLLSAVVVSTFGSLMSLLIFGFSQIHRHGDRNPYTTFKTDLYSDESHWPEGFGQLTKVLK